MHANHTMLGRVVAARLPTASVMSSLRNRGYEDARQGLPFCRDYDGWTPQRQQNYERGRQQWAITHRMLGGTDKDMLHTPAPKWRRNVYMKTALACRRLRQDSVCACCKRLGEPAFQALTRETATATFNDMTFTAYMRWFSKETA